VLDHWRDHPGQGLETYASGGWGPAGSDALIKPFGKWRNPESEGSRDEAPPASAAPGTKGES